MDVKKDVKATVETVKDSFSEADHKATAEAERARRELAGDAMTPSEKLGSVINEAKNNVQAGIDHAKVTAHKEV